MDDERAAERGEDFREKYLYAMAEIENVRKRSQRIADDTVQNFKKRMLLKLLPVLDNLQRAVAHGDSDEMRAGLAATLRGFESTLEGEGVTAILTTGEAFDPTIAEAIATERVADEKNNTVLAETQRGYLLGNEVLRPAKVIVVKNE